MRSLPALLTALLLAPPAVLQAADVSTPSGSGRPNILFIMADDHASDAISAYGSHLAGVFQTPNLDRLASQGARLSHVFCVNSICVPSRATILTGQYSTRNGVYTLNDSLRPDAATVARRLRDAGYATAIFGKWHLSRSPQPFGFDQYKALPGQGEYFAPTFIESQPAGSRSNGEVTVKREGYVTDLVTDFALDWLKQRDRSRPFFLCVHHKAPHHPWESAPRHASLLENVEIPEPPSRWEDKSLRSEGSRIYGSRCSPGHRGLDVAGFGVNIEKEVKGMSPADRARLSYQTYLKRYLRTIAAVDENVGRLLAFLDGEGLAENTVVIYTSDQGEMLGAHDYWDKRWIWDESIRMPFLIRYPREIAPGTVNADLVANVDFAQTLLDYAGVEGGAKEMQGRSFRANLRGRTPADWRQGIHYRYWMHLAHHDVPAHYGIRTRDYKLIFFYGLPLDARGAKAEITPAGWELYDLRKDPREMRNVYADPAYAAAGKQLKAQLAQLKQDCGDTDAKYPELLKRLRETN